MLNGKKRTYLNSTMTDNISDKNKRQKLEETRSKYIDISIKLKKIAKELTNPEICNSKEYNDKVDMILEVEESLWKADNLQDDEIIKYMIEISEKYYKNNKYVDCLIGLILSKDDNLIHIPKINNYSTSLCIKSWLYSYGKAESYLKSSIENNFAFANYGLAKLSLNNPVNVSICTYYKNDPKSLLEKGRNMGDKHCNVLQSMVYGNSSSSEYDSEYECDIKDKITIEEHDGKYIKYLLYYCYYITTIEKNYFEAYQWLLKCKELNVYIETAEMNKYIYKIKYSENIIDKYIEMKIIMYGCKNVEKIKEELKTIETKAEIDSLYSEICEIETFYKNTKATLNFYKN